MKLHWTKLNVWHADTTALKPSHGVLAHLASAYDTTVAPSAHLTSTYDSIVAPNVLRVFWSLHMVLIVIRVVRRETVFIFFGFALFPKIWHCLTTFALFYTFCAASEVFVRFRDCSERTRTNCLCSARFALFPTNWHCSTSFAAFWHGLTWLDWFCHFWHTLTDFVHFCHFFTDFAVFVHCCTLLYIFEKSLES